MQVIQNDSFGILAFETEDILGKIINRVEHGNVTHVAFTYFAEETESTIQKDETGQTLGGPQIHTLAWRLTHNIPPNTKVWHCLFTNEFDSQLNWNAAFSLLKSKVGPDKYNKLELVTHLLDGVPIIGSLHEAHYDPNQEVCCEYCLEILMAAGASTILKDKMVLPYNSTPKQLMSLPIYKSCVQLIGDPGTIEGLTITPHA